MDINNNFLQINSFLGGMNTDTSDSLIKPEQYRFAENLRLITNKDSNTGELHLLEGTGDSNCIKPEHKAEIKQIIAATSIRQYGVFITKNASDDWSIYRFTKEDNSSQLLFGPCSTSITNYGVPCLLTRYESEDNIKLYIADGEHQIMMLNISIIPNAVSTDIRYLTGHTDTILEPLDVKVSASSGQLNPAKVQYAYRLYAKNGSATKLSPLSKILSLYKNTNEGYPQEKKTGRAVDITFPTIDANYVGQQLNYIQIFRITYAVNGQAPDIQLIYDQKFTSGTYIDTGGNDIRGIAVADFLSYLSLGVIPKIIESKNDYMFAANVRYKQSEVDKDFLDVKQSPLRYFTLTAEIANEENSYTLTQASQADTIQQQIVSFRPNEVYRFGVILYDENGNASSVIHLQDLTIGDYNSYDWLTINKDYIAVHNLPSYTIRPIVVKVTQNLHIDKCSKYEIVRCIRTMNDKYTITQGIVGKVSRVGRKMPLGTYDEYSDDNYTNYVFSPGFVSLDDIRIRYNLYGRQINTPVLQYKLGCAPSVNIMQFTSPEYVYQSDDIKDILESYSGLTYMNVVARYSSLVSDQAALINWPDSPETNVWMLKYNSSMETRSIPLKLENGINVFYNLYGRYILNSESWVTLIGTHETVGDGEYSDRGGPNLDELGGRHSGKIAVNYLYPCEDSYAGRKLLRKSNSFMDYQNRPVQINIKDQAFPKVPEYNSFSISENLRLTDDVTRIGDNTYIGWTAAGLINAAFYENRESLKAVLGITTSLDYDDWDDSGYPYQLSTYFTGTSGKCILFETDYDKNNDITVMQSERHLITPSDGQHPDVYGYLDYGFPSIDVADVKKHAVPYGGTTDEAKENSVYYSFGQFFDNEVGASHQMQSGDCYITLFTYNAAHTWYDTTFTHVNQQCTVYSVPLFSDIDLRAQYGHRFNPDDNFCWNNQDEPVSFREYTQDKGAYLYNTAYNANPDVIGYTTSGSQDYDGSQYDTRVHFSEQKTNGEKFDSWSQFKAANFLDVDSRYGSITDMRLFKDKLIFWQEHATGLLAVNERIVLQDASETQVTLGTGGVLERSDYFSTLYGMKANQFADIQSNRSLYWWDEYNKEILQYTDKYAVNPLTAAYQCRNYMNNASKVNDTPKLVFDSKYNEILCQCVNDETLVFNEDIQRFTSVYTTDSDFLPMWGMVFDGKQYLLSDNNVYEHNVQSDAATLFGSPAKPSLTYTVNHRNSQNKTFDIQLIGGRLYGGDDEDLKVLFAEYKTPLKQIGKINNGEGITNREYDFRLNVPRDIQSEGQYGGRLKGKTMECKLWSTSNSTDFSLQYITTKYRISWA